MDDPPALRALWIEFAESKKSLDLSVYSIIRSDAFETRADAEKILQNAITLLRRPKSGLIAELHKLLKIDFGSDKWLRRVWYEAHCGASLIDDIAEGWEHMQPSMSAASNTLSFRLRQITDLLLEQISRRHEKCSSATETMKRKAATDLSDEMAKGQEMPDEFGKVSTMSDPQQSHWDAMVSRLCDPFNDLQRFPFADRFSTYCIDVDWEVPEILERSFAGEIIERIDPLDVYLHRGHVFFDLIESYADYPTSNLLRNSRDHAGATNNLQDFEALFKACVKKVLVPNADCANSSIRLLSPDQLPKLAENERYLVFTFAMSDVLNVEGVFYVMLGPSFIRYYPDFEPQVSSDSADV